MIESEVAFLSNATTEGQWLIRGARLCEWAEIFLAGRKVDWQEALSPTAELQAAIPGLNHDQAVALVSELGSHFSQLPRPLTVARLADELYPSRLWDAFPGRDHAAEWLLWLDSHRDLTPTEQQLLHVIAQQWQYQSPDEWKELYKIVAPEKAREVLEQWLGIAEPDPRLGEFPIEVPPEWVERVSTSWRTKLVQTRGTSIESLLNYPLPPELRETMGNVAHTYFVHNSVDLTEDRLDRLSPLISREQWQQLRRLVPPPEPAACPDSPGEVLTWFKDKYLPFREWEQYSSDQSAHGLALELAQQFAEWYLEFYPTALVSSSMSTYLSFFKLEQPREKSRFVTLLVVLDGLHVADARAFLRRLKTKTNRLTERQNEAAFTAIPTVTEFAKEALLKRVPPRDSADVPLLGEDISERKSPLDRLQSVQPGETFIWRIQEPDHTYHARNYYEMLEKEVEGQLQTVADKVAEVVNQLSGKIALRLVVTSDHGRLLATATRRIRIPDGMQAHGRAAWGPTGRAFPAAGYITEGNLAYVYGERFGLPEDAAIILDESAFLTNDGKQGIERYPHGGLFPEEVIVPWLELERDVIPTRASERGIWVTMTGQARAGQPGVLHTAIINPTEVPLVLSTIRLSFGDKRPMETVNVECEIPALKEHHVTSHLALWPSKDELRYIDGSVLIKWPTGDFLEVPATINIETEELYWRDTSLLEDLGLE